MFVVHWCLGTGLNLVASAMGYLPGWAYRAIPMGVHLALENALIKYDWREDPIF
jgi:hypothetical protein